MIPQQSELHFLGSHHCSHFTTRLLAAFSQRYKEVTISLNITNRKSLQEQLTNNEHDVSFHTGIEMSSNEAIKQAVEAGLGLGIVSIHTLELEL